MSVRLRHIAYASLAFFACLAALPTTIGSQASAETPIETFSSLPTFEGAKLSPDGNSIAYSVDFKGRRTIVYQKLDGSDRGLVPPPKDAEIDRFYWANDDVLLIAMSSYARRVEFTRETLNRRIISLDIHTRETTWLGEPQNRRMVTDGGKERERASQMERITDFLPDDPDHILLALDFNLNAQDEIYEVNVRSGKRKMVKSERHSIYRWYTDQKSEIRLGIGVKEGIASQDIFTIFKKEDGTWVNLDKTDWAERFDFLGFSKDPNIIYVTGQTEHGTLGLFTIQVESGEIVEQLFSHPKFDAGSVVYHPVTGYVAGVSYTDDHKRIKYFDKDLDLIKRSLDKVLPDTNNYIAGRAKERRAYLIFTGSASVPGAYYLFDRDKGQLGLITATRPDYDITKSASTKVVDIPARDGSTIPAYLTIPHGLKTPSNMPAVVLPHGGPHARDDADWDYLAQFLANRGYLVIKPNFRGSTGYGVSFKTSGYKQWGGLMQDDITDATKWLISEGYADPERICIAGGSYGGYAALMGAIKEQGLYKCSVSINGVTDIVALKASEGRYVGGEVGHEKIGLEGVKDREVSPFVRAKEINVPTLIIASADDRVVPAKQSEKMYKRLKKLGKKPRYIEMQGGDHFLLTAEARQTVLAEIETFLANHIGK